MDASSNSSARLVAIGEFPAYAGLLEYLRIPSAAEASNEAFQLIERDGGLELRPPGEGERSGIRAEFPPDSKASAQGARGPIAKAFGKKIDRVFDMTAGLGADAYRLADAGYVVRAWERNAAIYALLISGWGDAVAKQRVPKEIVSRLSFQWGDAQGVLPELDGKGEGAYFDPMYPAPKRSSALPKRRLQVLRELLGAEDSPVDLVRAMRERVARVVVKRPHHAPPILPNPSFVTETKLLRFDVYVNVARMEADDP